MREPSVIVHCSLIIAQKACRGGGGGGGGELKIKLVGWFSGLIYCPGRFRFLQLGVWLNNEIALCCRGSAHCQTVANCCCVYFAVCVFIIMHLLNTVACVCLPTSRHFVHHDVSNGFGYCSW